MLVVIYWGSVALFVDKTDTMGNPKKAKQENLETIITQN